MSRVDLVLLEGFRMSPYPKIEAVGMVQDRRLLEFDDPSVLAVTGEIAIAALVPLLPIDDVVVLADFVLRHACAAGTNVYACMRY